MTRACACGAEISARNKSGRCRPCSTRLRLCNPENRAKISAGLRRHFQDPVIREQHACASRARLTLWREREPERARELGLTGIKAAQLSLRDPAKEAARRRAIRRALLPGIPEHRWDEYTALAAAMPVAEARRIILADEAILERRRLAALSPLERQLERLRSGAKLVAKPVIRSTDPSITLGGVSSGML